MNNECVNDVFVEKRWWKTLKITHDVVTENLVNGLEANNLTKTNAVAEPGREKLQLPAL
jgi:hypothetical protein